METVYSDESDYYTTPPGSPPDDYFSDQEEAIVMVEEVELDMEEIVEILSPNILSSKVERDCNSKKVVANFYRKVLPHVIVDKSAFDCDSALFAVQDVVYIKSFSPVSDSSSLVDDSNRDSCTPASDFEEEEEEDDNDLCSRLVTPSNGDSLPGSEKNSPVRYSSPRLPDESTEPSRDSPLLDSDSSEEDEDPASHSVTQNNETMLPIRRKEKPFPCSFCSRSFARKGNLKKHIMVHTSKKPFSCTMCHLVFAEKTSLRDHILMKHIMRMGSGKPVHSARDRRISASGRLQLDTNGFIDRPTTCSYCHRLFSDKRLLKKHIIMKHIMRHNDKPLSCTYCARTFLYESSLRTHVMTHEKKKPFQCALCERSFTLKSNLKTHGMIHTNEKPFQCNACGRSFTRRSNLKTHVLTHSNEKPFSCSYCSRLFTHKNSLRRHIMLHKNEKLLACKICQRTFTHRISLTMHMMAHSNEKPYACSRCSRSFAQKNNLKKHMMFHFNVRPFSCTRCDRSFTQKSDLDRHIGVHANATLLAYSDCNRELNSQLTLGEKEVLSSFVDDDCLETPNQMHGEDRPYSCCYCNRSFTQKCDLKEHVYRDSC